MKGSFGAAALIIMFALPAFASAHWHDSNSNRRNPSPPVSTPAPSGPSQPVGSPVPPPTAGTTSYQNCANVGYGVLQNGAYNLLTFGNELTALKAQGITCVRNAAYGPNPTWAYPAYTLEVSMGFYVTVTADSDPTASSYGPALVKFATWAQANGISSIGVGNEDAKNASMVQTIDNLSCQVAAVFHGQISYDTYLDPSFDEIKAYAQNKGCLTALGLNVYAAYSSTFAEAQQYWGDNWFTSELGMDCDAFDCTNDAARAAYMKTNIIPSLSKYSVKAYWFAWDAGGDGVPSRWQMQNEPQTLLELGIH